MASGLTMRKVPLSRKRCASPHLFGWLIAALLVIPKLEAESDKPVLLLFAGDAMLAETIGEEIQRGVDPFQHFGGILKGADVRVVNLECVVSTRGKAIEDKPYTFQAHPRVLPLLERYFNVASLANNHTGDFGFDAFNEQLDLLEQRRFGHFGGGRNNAEARRPYLVTVNGLRIALLGYNDFHPRCFEAGPDWPGVAWCVTEQVVADIEAARSIHKADLVIPVMHWGEEEEPENERQKDVAHRMIDAGADVVVGGHPHVTQSTEYYKGKLIAYSLGNFVFDGFDEGPGRIGWVLRLRMDKNGLLEWDTVVAHLDGKGNPHPEKDALSPAGNARQGTMNRCKGLVDSPFAPFARSAP